MILLNWMPDESNDVQKSRDPKFDKKPNNNRLKGADGDQEEQDDFDEEEIKSDSRKKIQWNQGQHRQDNKWNQNKPQGRGDWGK